MTRDARRFTRREFLKSAVMSGLAWSLGPWSDVLAATTPISMDSSTMNTRAIPSSGERIPVVGLGTWQQFDVRMDSRLLSPLKGVLSTLFQTGGSVIDTSPMYGRSEAVLGRLLGEIGKQQQAFLATKVWTRGKNRGIEQMETSMDKLGVSTVDLMQVHNLIDWRIHVPTLKQWKEEGKIRYYGVTHYTGSAFDELARVMKQEPLDFVQLPYSIEFRRAEQQLLPLARERGIAVIVNRPFQAGELFRKARGRTLPGWVSDLGINSWAQYFLKFILGHPAVTCVIPGTSDPEHMLDNARAGFGTMPNSGQRRRMVEVWRGN